MVKDDYITRYKVCSTEIWVELFGRDIKYFHRGSALEINEILIRINGWESSMVFRGVCKKNIVLP